MVYDLRVPAAKAFEHLADNNPLKKLNETDRIALVALLKVHNVMTRERKSGDDPLEQLAKILADAATFGARLESVVFRGPHSKLLNPYTHSFADIPKRLVKLSQLSGALLGPIGKRGHKGRNIANRFLITASEVVQLLTGRHYDEHLAELFQAVAKRPLSEDLSGDAIRKKREYLKTRYPGLYADALKDALYVYGNLALRELLHTGMAGSDGFSSSNTSQRDRN